MVTLAIHQRLTKARQRYTSQRAEGKVRDEKWEKLLAVCTTFEIG